MMMKILLIELLNFYNSNSCIISSIFTKPAEINVSGIYVTKKFKVSSSHLKVVNPEGNKMNC